VLHLATRIPPLARMRRRSAWRENDRLRTDGARALVDAALAAGAGLYVQESITFLYADGGDDVIDEAAPIDAPWPLASAHDAERATARFAARGGRGVVLRFGLFYAAYAPSTRATIGLARRRMLPTIDGERWMSSIHVDDAAQALVAALAAASGVYNVVDDEPVRAREYAAALSAACGFGAAPRLPRACGRLLLGPGAPAILRSQRVTNAKLAAATGWSPRHRSVREGWRAIAAELSAAPAARTAS
jgi:NAD dependent epimerase/dehydratase family enzyme